MTDVDIWVKIIEADRQNVKNGFLSAFGEEENGEEATENEKSMQNL